MTPKTLGPRVPGRALGERIGPSVEESSVGSKDLGFPGEAATRVASDATWWPRPLLLGLQLPSQRGLTSGPLLLFSLRSLSTVHWPSQAVHDF